MSWTKNNFLGNNAIISCYKNFFEKTLKKASLKEIDRSIINLKSTKIKIKFLVQLLMIVYSFKIS